MIKVGRVMVEGFFPNDRARREQASTGEGGALTDRVTISEEGKKRRVMGHVMASITGPERFKKP